VAVGDRKGSARRQRSSVAVESTDIGPTSDPRASATRLQRHHTDPPSSRGATRCGHHARVARQFTIDCHRNLRCAKHNAPT
jgi:hypothetical protein